MCAGQNPHILSACGSPLTKAALERGHAIFRRKRCFVVGLCLVQRLKLRSTCLRGFRTQAVLRRLS